MEPEAEEQEREASSSALRSWREFSAAEWWLWGLVTLCVLGAFALRPLASLVTPEWAAAAAETRNPKLTSWTAYTAPSELAGLRERMRADEASRDPWGRPWLAIEERSPGFARVRVSAFSAGPNGVDEGGAGDDFVPQRLSFSTLLGWSRELLLLAASCVAWVGLISAFRASRARTEAFRSVGLALLPGALVARGWYLVLEDTMRHWRPWSRYLEPAFYRPWGTSETALDDQLATPLTEVSGTPGFVVLGCTVAAGCFLFAFAWRLRRPLEGSASAQAH